MALVEDKMKKKKKDEAVMKKFAETELGESDVNRQESVKKLLKFIDEHPEYHARTDERSLLTFLRCCKYNLENTKEKIRKFYQMKSQMPEWFTGRDPRKEQLLELIKMGVFVPIIPVGSGPLIVIIRTSIHDPSQHEQSNVFKVGNMILDLAVRDYEEVSVYGVHAILDMTGVSYGHARQMTPNLIKKAVTTWNHYHCRPQRLDFVNAPSYINVVLNIFRAFMTQKMKDRVHVHSVSDGCKNLPKNVSPSRLPVEYGGTNGSIQSFIDFWVEKTVENYDWFLDDEQYRADLTT